MITDFGEKIGGARKDLWKSRGMCLNDLQGLTEAEADIYVKRDNIWPKPKWEKIVTDEDSKYLCYWKEAVRKSIPTSYCGVIMPDAKAYYIDAVSKIRDAVMGLDNLSGAPDIIEKIYFGNGYLESAYGRYVLITQKGTGLINRKGWKLITSYQKETMRRNKDFITFGVEKSDKEYVIKKEQMKVIKYDNRYVKFEEDSRAKQWILRIIRGSSNYYYYSDQFKDFAKNWEENSWFILNTFTRKVLSYGFHTKEEAEKELESIARQKDESAIPATKRETKKVYKYDPIDNMNRKGNDLLHNGHITTDQFMKKFDFRGGQFGNWVSENDRQENLDQAYGALMDLANVLNIAPESIAFQKNLSIAFGARGTGGFAAAPAHYEPFRKVINLTKYKGAGTLAHEWAHALDHYLWYTMQDTDDTHLASEVISYEKSYSDILPEFKELINTLKYTDDYHYTEFYTGSNEFDKVFRKGEHGYWTSATEMFARAFDCYVSDKLKEAGIYSPYLTSHANSYVYESENGTVYYAYPIGEERTRINQCFDQLFDTLKSKIILWEGNCHA